MARVGANSSERREHPEPSEGARPVPWYIVILTVCLLAACIAYILHAQVDTPSDRGDGRALSELSGGPPVAGVSVDASGLYASSCAGCHQATGLGLPGAFPPLAGSEWVTGKPATAAAIVLHGVSGAITVNGVGYSSAMPAFKDRFDDAQLAALLTYLRSQWQNAAPAVDATTVAKVREQLKSRAGPFSGGAELEALP